MDEDGIPFPLEDPLSAGLDPTVAFPRDAIDEAREYQVEIERALPKLMAAVDALDGFDSEDTFVTERSPAPIVARLLIGISLLESHASIDDFEEDATTVVARLASGPFEMRPSPDRL
jgi:hypothetical protein